MQACIAEDASTTHNNVEKNNKIDEDANIASFIDSPGNNVDHTDFFDPQNGSNSRKENLPENAEAARHSVFPKGTRIFIVTMAAVCGVVSPLSGNIFYPALNPLSADLHVNQSLINVSLTTYMIFQGISPTLMGNLADTAGRRPAYIIGFTMYIGACIGLALQTSYPALLVLRCLQSSGSSSTIALGTAIAADVATAAERGTYMGLINGGALVGPALGPVLGGILVTFLGWRSIFWFLAIFSGVLLFLLVLAVPETGRNVVGNGSIPPQRWNRDLISVLRARWSLAKSQRPRDENSSPHSIPWESGKRKVRMPNPIATLKILKEKDVQLLLLYNCLVYASYFSVTSSLPYIFAQTYGLNDLQIGLSYLPYGVGALLASLFNGRVLDWRFCQVAKAAGFEIIEGQTTDTRNFPLEKVRFPIAFVLILIGNSALLCYGWVVQIQGPLAASLVLLFFIGYCISGSFNCSSIALIDYYPMSPATATAGNNLCRCLLGAGEAAVIIPMIDVMSCGWCFTFISLVIFAMTPILWVLMHWGPVWREKRAQRMEAEMISGFS